MMDLSWTKDPRHRRELQVGVLVLKAQPAAPVVSGDLCHSMGTPRGQGRRCFRAPLAPGKASM